jgi:hypothetical protein
VKSDDHAPTPPLGSFLRAYAEDDNEWWRLSCGHHLNLFDAAVEQMDRLAFEVGQLRRRTEQAEAELEKVVDWAGFNVRTVRRVRELYDRAFEQEPCSDDLDVFLSDLSTALNGEESK